MREAVSVNGRLFRLRPGVTKSHLTLDGRFVELYQWEGYCAECDAPFLFWNVSEEAPVRPNKHCKEHARGGRWRREVTENEKRKRRRHTINKVLYWRAEHNQRKLYRGKKCFQWFGHCECRQRIFSFPNPGREKLRFKY